MKIYWIPFILLGLGIVAVFASLYWLMGKLFCVLAIISLFILFEPRNIQLRIKRNKLLSSVPP
jgi:hypothetical protein